LEPHYQLVKLDTEAHPEIGSQFAIRSIPTLALFVGGREVARQPGAMGAAEIVRWTHQHTPR
jgi:thioredoxin 2